MGFHGARDAYLEQICEVVKQGEDIILVSADLAAPCLDAFRRNYPQRYLSVGIAEQNLIAVACGLAMAGKKVIAYAANPFPILRAFDQIRNAVALMNLPVTIVGVGAGFSIPEYGATHFTIEDINIIRTCPNIKLINISDQIMAREIAEQIVTNVSPCYLRFDKTVSDAIDMNEKIDFKKGFRVLSTGNDFAVITSGSMTKKMMDFLQQKNREDFNVKLIDLFAVPVCEAKLIEAVSAVKAIVTIEELVLPGGIGSLLLEILADAGVMIPVKRLGINLKDGYAKEFGSTNYFLKKYGLDEDSINENLVKFFSSHI
jgi:transketolase